tara:strand:+ start:227 stop:412 length:186 start_codon:yes stop_codon:yes gene_type:complete
MTLIHAVCKYFDTQINLYFQALNKNYKKFETRVLLKYLVLILFIKKNKEFYGLINNDEGFY